MCCSKSQHLPLFLEFEHVRQAYNTSKFHPSDYSDWFIDKLWLKLVQVVGSPRIFVELLEKRVLLHLHEPKSQSPQEWPQPRRDHEEGSLPRTEPAPGKVNQQNGWGETLGLGHTVWVTRLFKNRAHKFPLLFKAVKRKVLFFAAESFSADIPDK